jgi:hypothetical protein
MVVFRYQRIKDQKLGYVLYQKNLPIVIFQYTILPNGEDAVDQVLGGAMGYVSN